MLSNPIEVRNVWKKFKKGEYFDSLRDYIPRLAKRILNNSRKKELEEREFWALKDISFRVKNGEALGIIGPNGSGKSTMLKLLSGILKPNRGEVIINGRLSALIEVGAGFHPDLTGRENIFLNGTIMGMTRDEIKRKFDEIVEFSELQEFIDTPVKRYSSGMFARLGFSVAAHIDPDVLLIDEVLSVGDFMFQHKCLKKMEQIVNSGASVVFVSHNIPQVIKLCPKCILISKGEIKMVGNSERVCRYFYRANAETMMIDEKVTLKIAEFQLYDQNSSPSNAFISSDWATAKVVLESESDYSDLIMGFFVKTNDGMVIYDVNSDKYADIYYNFEKNRKTEITLKFRVNLPEGTYYIGIHFMNKKEQFYVYEDEIMEFFVAGPKTMGYAFLDTNWK
jgi:lipopolysaccharide transport system ATP-binding protein